jgi:hypothetical protein
VIWILPTPIASTSQTEHERHLRLLFARISEYGVLINSAKCVFGASEVKFLGHTVNADGTRPLHDKVEAIASISPPSNVKQLRQFLGTINFYRRFQPSAAQLQSTLNDLLVGADKSGKTPIVWTPELLKTFEACKRSLSQAPRTSRRERRACHRRRCF